MLKKEPRKRKVRLPNRPGKPHRNSTATQAAARTLFFGTFDRSFTGPLSPLTFS
jgi:hypothetical protein